jgi:hypothetical protein
MPFSYTISVGRTGTVKISVQLTQRFTFFQISSIIDGIPNMDFLNFADPADRLISMFQRVTLFA